VSVAANPRKITIDIMDIDSIDAGLRMLDQYERWEQAKRSELMENLAKLAVKAASMVYASQHVSVTWKWSNNHTVEIVAGGTDQIAFIEFGAGVYAEPQMADAGENLGIKIYPGSWSDEYGEKIDGKSPAQRWRDSHGGSLQGWPYNRQARPGLQMAYNAICKEYASIARRTFK
jgi:hypothetical protein